MNVTMFLGIAGLISGGVGSITGVVAFLRATEIKVLDLRLEMRRELSDAHALLSESRQALQDANKVHTALLSMRGLNASGAMQIWGAAVKIDRTYIADVSRLLPKEDKDFSGLNFRGLELEIVKIHALKRKLSDLAEKYAGVIERDNGERQQIAGEIRSSMQRMRGPLV